MLKNSYMASNLTSLNAEDTLTSGSVPQIISTNTAGTKEINLSLKISVIVPQRNIPRACYKCKIISIRPAHTWIFYNQLDDQRNYPKARLFCCYRPFASDKIVQCTLHRLVYSAETSVHCSIVSGCFTVYSRYFRLWYRDGVLWNMYRFEKQI